MEFAEIARPASGYLQCRYPCPAAGRLHRVRFFAIFVCRRTVSVGQFGASVLPVAPAAVIPVGWLRPLRVRGGRRRKVRGLFVRFAVYLAAQCVVRIDVQAVPRGAQAGDAVYVVVETPRFPDCEERARGFDLGALIGRAHV